MKNPLTIHYHHHAALWTGRWLAGWARKRLDRALTADRWRPTRDKVKNQAPLNLVTLAGKKSLAEAVIMLDSFYAHVGEPLSCRIISDGSLTPDDASILARIHPAITLLTLDQFITTPLPHSLEKRLHQHPMMKKLAVLIELSQTPNGLYVDSDFLFFPAARRFDWPGLLAGPGPLYMHDVAVTLDHRLLDASEIPPHRGNNAGLVLFNRPLELAAHAPRLDRMGAEPPHHFSEQTIVHLALTQAGATPLDPRRFVLAVDDQFRFRDHHARRSDIICRHYTSPLRHKFWLQTLFPQPTLP